MLRPVNVLRARHGDRNIVGENKRNMGGGVCVCGGGGVNLFKGIINSLSALVTYYLYSVICLQ